ncbi:MAG TPA: sigma-70 family RNA polymerase sigma factor [Microthrixaceae bacterium]|nr:sigma-70 family RNA polymerase sigma factor [Microthrixaceae bacterium]
MTRATPELSPDHDERDDDADDERAELAALAAAARDGDRDAFEELVKRTHAATYTLAMRLTMNEEDARDVTQEAYLRAFRGLKNYRGDAQFTTWLYRITANCASTFLTTRSRHRHDDLGDGVEPIDPRHESDVELMATTTELRDRVDEALADLPPRLRAVVVLRDVYDLPHEAIAAELGISVSAAKVRLHRARHKMRTQLFPEIDEVDVRAV